MCFGACLLRPCTWSGSQKITRSRTYNAPGAGFCFGLDYGQQTGGRQNGMEFCVFSQQRFAGRGAGDGCVFGVHGKRPARPEDDEKQNGEDRGHLRHFSGGNADDRLGVRAYHRGAVFVL